MAEKYTEYRQLNMPAIEQDALSRWRNEKTFEQSIINRNGAQPFVFYEGPPSANGMPGIHHVISRTLKDLVCRYKTMKGFQVKRKAGWDTHGLPVELGVEKELGITKEDIGKKISVEEYNQKCREAVMRYKREWEDITEKMGYWVDMADPYITFDNKYIETLWWCLKQLYEKDLLYKSVSIQPYSPAAGTGLSSHELNQPGCYRDVKDTTIVAMFKANAHEKLGAADGLPVYFLAWTTTPWTLPSNCGLTVGPNIDYVTVKTFNPYTHQSCNVVLAKALLHKYFKPEGENGDFIGYSAETKLLPWQIISECKGRNLEGIRYQQLMPFEGNTAEIAGGDPFRVILGDFVTTEDGTGIVHTAPAFGADDYKAGKKANIGMLTMVDKEGKFTEYMGEFSGRYIKNYKSDSEWKDVDLDIALKLKGEGLAFKIEKYEHSYPHCWRTDKPVIYYPLDAWFIRTTAAKDRMIELNKTINWKPKATGEGRFGNWLENMVDWNLSRSRFWGTPLPVWVSEDGAERKCIGSMAELHEEIAHANKVLGLNQFMEEKKLPSGEMVRDSFSKEGHGIDLHKPYVDQIILATQSGKPMHREPDLIDVWFDSGAMPYAQWHYPFENKNHVTNNGKAGGSAFPADFIAEGVDQTRGWFYTLHALGVLLFDTVAYKTVVSNGLVLDKNGNKMSKRIGNVVDPFSTIAEYSADATRWYLITNASPWDSLRFDIEGIKEVQRKFFGTLYNTYQFFALYANVDGFAFKEAYIPVDSRPEIDRWILSTLQTLINTVTAALDDYEPTQAGRAIEYFLDEQLSNWYVRLCRRRFWKGEYEHDKISAYQTLYECLEALALLIAPVSPFFADWLFSNLNLITGRNAAASVHLADFPVANAGMVDAGLEERMQLAQDVSSLILSLRKKLNIKVRQPLQKAMIPAMNAHIETQITAVAGLIKNEVNIKSLEFMTAADNIIHKKLKADFKALGAKLGPKMKEAAAAIAVFSQEDINHLEQQGVFSLPLKDGVVEIALSDVAVLTEDIPGWSVASKDTLTIALDTVITPELAQEGIARELVNRIQNIRKTTGLAVTDRINGTIQSDSAVAAAIIKYNDYICAEILAQKIETVPDLTDAVVIDLNERPVKILITKV